MTYFDFMQTSREPNFISSRTESEAAGVVVARMNVPVGLKVSGAWIASAFASSGADIGILRYPSQMVDLSRQLAEARLRA